jgi:hypothetical protein
VLRHDGALKRVMSRSRSNGRSPWFLPLAASSVCAALAGLATSAFVRWYFPEMRPAPPPPPPAAQGVQADQPRQDDIPAKSLPEIVGATPKPLPSSSSRSSRSTAAKRRLARIAPDHDTFEQELNRGIRKLGESRYEIDPGTFTLALGNLGILSRWVRVAPDLHDGKSFGFRLFAVKIDGPFAKLGLRDEDVLVSVNGLDIATIDHALDAYGKLKTARHFTLGLVRAGSRTTHEYTVR